MKQNMKRQPREYKPWWSSPEEEKLALDELHAALDKQENDKDYHKNIKEHVLELVNQLESNENFQKMITGIFTPPVFIRENSDMQDEVEKLLLEEYDTQLKYSNTTSNEIPPNEVCSNSIINWCKKEESTRGGNNNSKKKRLKRTNKKRKKIIKLKLVN